MLSQPWRIELFGGLRARQGEQVLARFRTQKTGALLAFLAFHRTHLHPREEIAGILWPESDVEAGRASLRTALASLRHQLEPPGTPAKSVLPAYRNFVGLNAGAISTDVADFGAAIRAATQAATKELSLEADLAAIELYRGELLAGWYEEWIFPERERLADQYLAALDRVVAALEDAGKPERAVEYSLRMLAADSYNEEAHLRLIRLYASLGRIEAARRQFHDLQRTVWDPLGAEPSEQALALADTLGARARIGRESSAAGEESAGPPSSEAEAQPRADKVKECAESEETPLVSAAPNAIQSNPSLPLPLTRFFGRETEISQLEQMLEPCLAASRDRSGARPSTTTRDRKPRLENTTPGTRLLTLTGPGGSGKTRLAIEVAYLLAPHFNGAVSFVPLAEIAEARRVPEAIAEALHLPPGVSADPLQPIVERLGDRPHLLVLDNFEQLLGSAAQKEGNEEEDGFAAGLVHRLLTRAPRLACLVTSRQRLEVAGEQEYLIPPLPTPDWPGTPERLMEFASVQLFVNRAQAARADFQLTPRNVEAVGALCRRLEGVPLALELAAAWAQVLSPAQMLSRLERRFELLVSRRKGIASRHQTLRAAIDWSYRLLPPDLQRCFARLSVFCGGWTLEAAESVSWAEDPGGKQEEKGLTPTSQDPWPPTKIRVVGPDTLQDLMQLHGRSLVTTDEISLGDTQVMRFRMLETLREYARERMSGAEQRELSHRHARYYLQLAAEANRNLWGPSQSVWLDRLEMENENLRMALEWCGTAEGDLSLGLKLAGEVHQFWTLRGRYAEGRLLVERILDRAQGREPTSSLATALWTAGLLAKYQHDWLAARRHFLQRLRIERLLQNPHGIASALCELGSVAIALHDYEAARAYYEQGLSCFRTAGSEMGAASALSGFATLAEALGDYAGAIVFTGEALEVQRRHRNLNGAAHYLNRLALLDFRQGNGTQARACADESLELYGELKDVHGTARFLHELAGLLPTSIEVVQLLAAAQSLNASTTAAPFGDQTARQRARAALGDRDFDAAWTKGSGMTLAQAIAAARATVKQQPARSSPTLLRS